jgi:hypothetical protein
MPKSKSVAVTNCADLASRALARLETDAEGLVRRQCGERRLQLVSSERGLSALIKADGVTIQVENGAFAVSIDQAEPE